MTKPVASAAVPRLVHDRPGAPPPPSPEQRQRQGLLAQWHIALKDLGLNPGEKEAILSGFKVKSSRELSIVQLERLVTYMKHLGWKPKRRSSRKSDDDRDRLAALRARVLAEAKSLRGWETRLPGLTRAICGVAALSWVHSAAKLERLLAVIAGIKANETAKEEDHGQQEDR